MFHVLRKLDWWLLTPVLALFLASLLNLYGIGGFDSFFIKQLVFVLVGLVLLLFFASIDFRIFRESSIFPSLLYIASLIFLLGTLYSSEVRGIKAWFFIGSFGFEPSEVTKLALILFLAKFFSSNGGQRTNQFLSLGASLIYALIPIGFILLQPDFGSAAVLGTIWLSALMNFKIKKTHMLFSAGVLMLLGIVIWIFMLAPYQKARLTTFLNPLEDPRGSGFQNLQAQISVGSGNWFGYGIQNSTQVKLGYLSEPRNDFAFAAFAQQFGFLGTSLVIILYGLFLYRLSSIGIFTKDRFTHIFVFGFLIFISTHLIINIGMNIGVLPVTGIPLSFFSYGGSHLLTLMSGLGIVQSIKVHTS